MQTRYIILIHFLVSSLAAQSEWESIGPEGGWFDRVVFHPSGPDTMYAGGDTHGAFYRSTDGGNTWHRIESFGSYNVWDLVVDSTSPNIIYVGNIMDDSLGILRSTDAGNTWSTILAWPDIGAIAIHPSDPNTIYAGAGYWPNYQSHGVGIWKTTDGGAAWAHIGLDSMNVQSIAISPATPNLLYAAVYVGETSGVHMSTDNGNSWLWAGLYYKDVWKIMISPDSTNILYAVTFDSVYKSTDYGFTWTSLPVPTTDSASYFFALDIAPSNNDILYVGSISHGVFKSTDRGATWVDVNSNLPARRIWSLQIHLTNPDIVFISQMGQGIQRTTNGGASWTSVNTGLKCHYCFDILTDENSNLYAGFYNEQDNNLSSVKRWNFINWEGLGVADKTVMALAIDPVDSKRIYAATKYEWGNHGDLYRSENAGTSWVQIGTGLPDSFRVETLAIDPANTAILYAGTALGFVYQGGVGVYKSMDHGDNWVPTSLDSLMVNRIIIHPDSNQIIWAATLNNVYKSTDAGGTWQATGLPGIAVLSLVVSPAVPQQLFAGTYFAGVFRSTDGGINWQQVGFNGQSVTALTVDAALSYTVYAGGAESILPGWGVYRSSDGGNTWEDFSQGMVNYEVSSLAITPMVPGAIFAATLGYGIYQRWRSPGVYESSWNPIFSQQNRLYVSPSLFRHKTTITYSINNRRHVQLSIYDASGRLARILVDDVQTGGLHTMTWDTRDMNGELVAGGTYFITLEVEKKLCSRAKVVVLN